MLSIIIIKPNHTKNPNQNLFHCIFEKGVMMEIAGRLCTNFTNKAKIPNEQTKGKSMSAKYKFLSIPKSEGSEIAARFKFPFTIITASKGMAPINCPINKEVSVPIK